MRNKILSIKQEKIERKAFIFAAIKKLTSRYSIVCSTGNNKYAVYNKSTKKKISRTIQIRHFEDKQKVTVMQFFPDFQKEKDKDGLSAALFYLIVHHYYKQNNIKVDADVEVSGFLRKSKKFYLSLRDFGFSIEYYFTRPKSLLKVLRSKKLKNSKTAMFIVDIIIAIIVHNDRVAIGKMSGRYPNIKIKQVKDVINIGGETLPETWRL
jgi:hypothetical protein